jgi:hypothetical protein
MNSGNFTKVFDLVDVGFRGWSFSAFGLIFVAFGIGLVMFPTALRAVKIPYLDFRSGKNRYVGYLFLGFALLWTVGSFWQTYSQHLRHMALISQNQCRIVEGSVEHFVPMPYGGHAVESFSVAGIVFRYSDFYISDGFNNAASHGGPIAADSYVRICYDPRDNAILRLEIRDFKGEPKDYSAWSEILPTVTKFLGSGHDGPESPAQYGVVFMGLFLLDLLGIRMLLLPYLRLFFRIGTASGLNHRLPVALERDRRIELTDTTLYWDDANHAIWLRPSGFNMFQVPSTVAKLTVDGMGGRVIGSEIRFSSGMILWTMLMVWIAYQFLANAPSKAAPPPAVLIAFSAFGIFAIVMNMRKLRNRMQKLIDGATAELSIM